MILLELCLIIQKTRPDVVICVFQTDTGENIEFATLFPNTIIYPPVEGRKLPFNSLNGFKRIMANGGKIVAQCNSGQREMEKDGIKAPVIYQWI